MSQNGTKQNGQVGRMRSYDGLACGRVMLAIQAVHIRHSIRKEKLGMVE